LQAAQGCVDLSSVCILSVLSKVGLGFVVVLTCFYGSTPRFGRKTLPLLLGLLAIFTLFSPLNSDIARASDADVSKPCALEEVAILCGKGRKTITHSMAHTDSRRVVTDRNLVQRLVANGGEREMFRKSLERNRYQMVRFLRGKLRAMKRRRISAARFEDYKALYAQGMGTYKAGLLTYRQSIWLRKQNSNH